MNEHDEKEAVRRHRSYGLVIVTLSLLVAFSVVAVIFFRARTTDQRDSRLCGVLVHLIAQADASLDLAAYYREHPDELARAHRNNRETIRALDCKELVPVNGRFP